MIYIASQCQYQDLSDLSEHNGICWTKYFEDAKLSQIFHMMTINESRANAFTKLIRYEAYPMNTIKHAMTRPK